MVMVSLQESNVEISICILRDNVSFVFSIPSLIPSADKKRLIVAIEFGGSIGCKVGQGDCLEGGQETHINLLFGCEKHVKVITPHAVYTASLNPLPALGKGVSPVMYKLYTTTA